MFKLVQSTGKALGGIVTSAIAAGQPLKIIKTVSAGGQDQQQSPQQVRFCFVFFYRIVGFAIKATLINSRFIEIVLVGIWAGGRRHCCVISLLLCHVRGGV